MSTVSTGTGGSAPGEAAAVGQAVDASRDGRVDKEEASIFSKVTDDGPGRSRWRPGVRFVLVLVVLIPMLSVAFLTASDASSRWSYRQGAQVVAKDAIALKQVALASAQTINAMDTAYVVVLGSQLGLSESQISALMGVDLGAEIRQEVAVMRADRTFVSTPTLRADSKTFLADVPRIQAGTAPSSQSGAVNLRFSSDAINVKFSADIADLWFSDFNRLQKDVDALQTPGSFGVRVASLRQTYTAFEAMDTEIGAAALVLLGEGSTVATPLGPGPPMSANQQLLWTSGEYGEATSSFVGRLGPKAQAAWDALQRDPHVLSTESYAQLAFAQIFSGGQAPFLTHPTEMGTASVNAVTFVSDLGALVAAASQDLRNTALAQASGAASKFVDELIFLLALALISFAGVLIATNVLTRPLKKLATAAVRIHNGDFDLERLPASGPREVVSTITTFNDMTSILKSVEAKTVALSSEDLSHPALQVPLPGRTGRALQAAVDRLTTRIRDREVQRQVLQEEATHDPLTGLLNRHAIFDFLATDVSRRREGGETVAVLFADLDGLKTLNDTYGHEAGDTAIRVTAEALCQATGRCDVIGRVGGDEFLVVLCTEHSGDSAAVVERIRDGMTRCTVSVRDLLIPLFCSVGLALAECDADTDPMELVRRADAAMYEAKKAARTTGDSIAAAGGAVGTIA